MPHDALPPDPFEHDPDDPARALDALDDLDDDRPLDDVEREELVADIADLAVYQALLAPHGVRGIVVDCQDCEEPHFHDWELLRANLQQLLDGGAMRPHEPAFHPDHTLYVSWEYCRGYADATMSLEAERTGDAAVNDSTTSESAGSDPATNDAHPDSAT